MILQVLDFILMKQPLKPPHAKMRVFTLWALETVRIRAPMYLSQFARNIYIIVRKPDLTATVSSVLIDQINSTENIHVLGKHQVEETKGGDRLEHLVIEHGKQSAV